MIVVLDRVTERHPYLSKADVRMAWRYAVVCLPRDNGRPFEYIALGFDVRGRPIEMLGRRIGDDHWAIWHAFTPPTRKALREMGLEGR